MGRLRLHGFDGHWVGIGMFASDSWVETRFSGKAERRGVPRTATGFAFVMLAMRSESLREVVCFG